jgi:xylulokinase
MKSGADVTVGIDIGTTSVKAVAVKGSGDVVARTRVRHPLTGDADRLRHDARRAWRNGPRRALRQLGDLRPRAVTITGMVPSMTAVDRRGQPVTPGLLYGDTTGGRDEPSETPTLTGDAPQFLRALTREAPQAAGYWPAQTTAVVALGGPAILGTGVAGVLFPLVQNGSWDSAALAECGVSRDQLPRIVPDYVPVADVDGMLLDGGAIDVMCETLVSGVSRPGDVLVITGSTLIVIARLPAGSSPQPTVLAFPDETGAVTATAASNAGALFLDWVDRTVARSKAAVSPDRVPVWSPYIRGERTPWQDPDRRAGLYDLHLGHDAAAVRRGAFEASAFVVRHLLELMDCEAARLVVSGGGTRSDGLLQALADGIGVPVDAAVEPETAAIGAAFFARMTAGLETDPKGAAKWARQTRRVEPDPDWVGPVAARYRRFRELAG